MTLARRSALAALSVLLVATIWVVPYIPTNDGPEWVYLTHVLNHLRDPHTHYAVEYSPALQFASRGFTTLYAPLEAWLGWETGLRVALSLMVLLVAWGFVALVHALDRRRWALGLLGFPLALSWHLYMGFWSFVIGGGAGLFIVAIAIRGAPSRALLSLLLLLQAITHVFSAVLTGGVILVLLVARAPRGGRLLQLGKVLLLGLPAGAVLAASAVASEGKAALMFTRVGYERLSWERTVELLPQTLSPGPIARALLVSALIAAALVVGVARARHRETAAADRALAMAGLALLLIGALAPLQVPGWSFFSQRFLPLGAALVIAVVPVERAAASVQRAAAPLLFIVASTWLFVSIPLHRRLAHGVQGALAGLAAPVVRGKRQLPIALAPAEGPSGLVAASEVPMLNPLLHMGALYAVALGGVVPSVFTVNESVHPLVRRPVVGEPEWMFTPERYWGAVGSARFLRDSAFREATLNELASLGVFYEGVVLLAPRADDLALWSERGYVTDWEGPRVYVGHFKACNVDVAVTGSVPEGVARFKVRVGNYQLVSDAHPAPRVDDAGVTHFDVPHGPCGADVAVTARWLRAGKRTVFCANADDSGELHAAITRTAGQVACAAPAPLD